jgi:bacterioferritin-associated ferredoxin
MFICVCNAIREDDLRTAAQQGLQCAKRAYAEMGRRPKCGMCLPQARAVMAQEGVTVTRDGMTDFAG